MQVHALKGLVIVTLLSITDFVRTELHAPNILATKIFIFMCTYEASLFHYTKMHEPVTLRIYWSSSYLCINYCISW